MCYVRSYDQNLLVASSIGTGISTVIHLGLGIFLFVKQRRLTKAAKDERKINQAELEQKIRAAQRGDNPAGDTDRGDDYKANNNEVQNGPKAEQPGIGGF